MEFSKSVIKSALHCSNKIVKKPFTLRNFTNFVKIKQNRIGTNWCIILPKKRTITKIEEKIIIAPITDKTITTYSVCWQNPYTNPPNKAPKTLLWEYLEPGENRNALSERLLSAARKKYPQLKKELELGGGYSIGINFSDIKKPIVRSPESILKTRKSRALKKVKKDCPLFVDDEYKKILSQAPDYFNLAIITSTQAKRLKIKLELWENDFHKNNNIQLKGMK
jgi:hypothetical protein